MLFPRFRFAIDRGGTFTDVVATVEASDGSFQVTTRKLLSRNPSAYPDAPSEGIRRVLRDFLPEITLTAKQQQQQGDTHADPTASTALIAEAHIAEIRMGTTVATNALLERQGVRSVLVVTRGFVDVLAIGNQTRPKLFDLNVVKNMPLSEVVVEATERVRVVRGDEKQAAHLAETTAQRSAATAEASVGGSATPPPSWINTPTGHTVDVLVPIDLPALRGPLQAAYDTGIRSIAISLLHAYAFPGHEAAVVALAQAIGFTNISASHRLMPMVKYVPRTTTASVDAYLSPLITAYIANFRQNFSHGLSTVNLLFIQSDGALARADDFFGFRAVLSGPAGGVVGCAATTAHDLGPGVSMVGFDMGGTSTDVCRCEGLAVSHEAEAEIAGTTLQAPQVAVHTVAAGGGSVLAWRHGMYVVGPESAGAMPGPACYGNGGPLTVTDANLLLGRIRPEFFPRTFGPHANQGIDVETSRQKFLALRASIATTAKDGAGSADAPVAVPSIEEMAESFILVANETMCRAIRNLTESKGYRGAEHVLTVFGGAGGQHACAVAKNLGMSRVYLHKYASFLSAVGASLTDVVVDQTQPCLLRADREEDILAANQQLRALAASAKKALLEAESQKQGHSDSSSSITATNSSVARVELEHIYFMRFEGTSSALPVTAPDRGLSSSAALIAAFEAMYQAQFGFLLQKRAILIDDIKVRARGVSPMAAGGGGVLGPKPSTYDAPYHSLPALGASSNPADDSSSSSSSTAMVYFSGKRVATRTLMAWPRPGTQIAGPAIICGNDTTVVVEPHCTAFITENGNMVLHTNTAVEAFSTALHPLTLSIFSQRFMSIAEQMGYALQRTSISTNIKERLDFSCAIFDRDGQLVANAPHIPVHLGAMGAAVRWQRDWHGAAWAEGDVMVSNHPSAGGSHLPDITVMTPCWHNGQPIFYVASRGHHADVGGSTPGSMPPFSASLAAEGIPIKTFRLVKGGVFQDDGIRAVLSGKAPCEGSGSAGLAGVQGCRAIEDNLSDLRAQVAANHRGVELVRGLIAAYGIDVVLSYMKHIQAAAEGAARQVLCGIAQRYGSCLTAEDSMDDGTRIALEVRIDAATGDAVFDFAGTGSQVMGSTNCPTAVVHSAIIYAIRCLVRSDIPLNQGCMAPVTVRVPPASILAPEEDCAVVAGNVLTSQRVTDVIFTALQACACSQGCMNNFTMGNAAFGYYETICGGMGAGETFDGASAVQCHMTNTRITDPELLELRYPVLLRQFAIRRGTGGLGQHRGGDGVTRSILFLAPMTVCLLTERRAMPPRGLRGGLHGQKGVNVLMLRTDSAAHRLPPSAMLRAASGNDDNGVTLRKLMWAADATTTAASARAASDFSAAGVFSCRSLGGKNVVEVRRGDVVVVHSPGGGGFGAPIAAQSPS
jgi:5-oxoprolinase (ATP-hydrolysing)